MLPSLTRLTTLIKTTSIYSIPAVKLSQQFDHVFGELVDLLVFLLPLMAVVVVEAVVAAVVEVDGVVASET